MSRDMEEIGAYEARVHWGRLLEQVQAGSSYLISKRRQAVAAIVPLDQVAGPAGSSDEQELALLIDQFQRRHQETLDELEAAFDELEALRNSMAASRRAREEALHQQPSTDTGGLPMLGVRDAIAAMKQVLIMEERIRRLARGVTAQARDVNQELADTRREVSDLRDRVSRVEGAFAVMQRLQSPGG